MGFTNFPNGITSFGVPVMPSYGVGPITGSVFFVHSGTGSDTATQGSAPDKPFATLDYAIGQCTDYKGDIIYLMPGHYESISSDITLDKSGISVVGLGRADGISGFNGASINIASATASVSLQASSVLLQNITFTASAQDVAQCIVYDATGTHGFRCIGCNFYDVATDQNFLQCIDLGLAARASYAEIAYCHANCPDVDNTHFIDAPGTPAGVRIHHNVLMGDWGVGCIGGTTNVTGVLVNVAIYDNIILNVAATADGCINLAATATGVVARNMCGGGHPTDGINIGDAAGLENYYRLHTADLSGVIEPATA